MNYTPGPWRIDGKPGYEAPEIHATNRRIARVLYHLGSEDREVDANARLIAAAPELLVSLQELMDLVEDIIDGAYVPDDFTLRPACKAVAKATKQ